MEDKRAFLSNQREISTPFCSVSLHECKCHDCTAKLNPIRLPRRLELNMRYTVLFMTGLGFFFGILVGLLIQLPGASLPFKHEELQQTINIHYSEVKPKVSANAVVKKRMVAPFLNGHRLLESRRIEKGPNRAKEAELAVVQYSNNSLALKETPHADVPYLNVRKPKEPSQPKQDTVLPLDTEVHLTLTIPVNQNSRKSEGQETEKRKPNPGLSGRSKNLSMSDIVDGIYWRPSVENACVMGFSEERRSSWRRKANSLQIIKMEEGCGRMQNRLLTFRDSSKACARYRLNTDQIQGDLFSYYLSRLLKINNVAPSIAIAVQPKHSRWSEIHLDIAESQWAEDQVVVLSQWLADLQPTFIPQELRGEGFQLHPNKNSSDLTSKSPQELCELSQWSDLVIFDYLVANLDRVVNNMFNKQWNANMMKNPTHNLLKIPSNHQLVFLDNESGLFHGYRLLDKYHVYHESILKSLCIFRKQTVDALKKLHLSGNVGNLLKDSFTENETYHYLVPSMPEKNVKILKERLAEVYRHIENCEQRYS